MTKAKNRAPVVKAPKPAAAKPGVVKPKAATKPGLAKPFTKGKENIQSRFEHGTKRARSPESSDAEPGARRKRKEPARFGDFQQHSQSVGSPDSQSGTQAAEPVGAHEAREAAALNRMAETSLAPFLDWIPEEPSLMEKMDPHVQRMRADKAMRDKEKAEARQRAQQAADSYVPVDQRKLPSPIKRCPQLERAREELLHKGGRKSMRLATPSGETHRPSPQPPAADKDRELQAAQCEISNLRAQLLLKEGEVQQLKQQLTHQHSLEQQVEELQQRNELLEAENERIQAVLSESQSAAGKKVAKSKKVKELRAEMEGVLERADGLTEEVRGMMKRLAELESS